jgi:hypothetical protein
LTVPVIPPVFGNPGLLTFDFFLVGDMAGDHVLNPGILNTLSEFHLIDSHDIKILHCYTIEVVFMQHGSGSSGLLKPNEFHRHSLEEVHALVFQQLCNCIMVESLPGGTFTLGKQMSNHRIQASVVHQSFYEQSVTLFGLRKDGITAWWRHWLIFRKD